MNILWTHLLRHKAGQEGRGEFLLEYSFWQWQCYQRKLMHTTSNNFSVLYVLKKHWQHINNTMTPPTLLFLASWPSHTRALDSLPYIRELWIWCLIQLNHRPITADNLIWDFKFLIYTLVFFFLWSSNYACRGMWHVRQLGSVDISYN